MNLLRQRGPGIPLKPACEVLGVPRATAYRHLRPLPRVDSPRELEQEQVRSSPRSLGDEEKTEIVEVMHSERFADQTVRQAHAELLDEGRYIASVRTFYRVLAALGETRDRRNQRAPQHHAVPRLEACRPNAVWSWDITKLRTFVSGVFLNLYLVLDLYSRYPVAWMVAERENSALSKQLFSEAIARHEVEPGSIIVHSDRGAPMTALGFTDLLAELGVDRSLSRPRVSNDNAYSESCFKTVKQQPDYPGRFHGVDHARAWSAEFIDWYANRHRHSGLAFFTPADVFFGRVPELAAVRQAALDKAYAAHPERFVRGRPTVPLPPKRVLINPPELGVSAPEAMAARAEGSQLVVTPTTSTAPAEASTDGNLVHAGAATTGGT